MQGMDVGYCPKDGFLAYHLEPGAKVKKGQAVCDVIDPANPHGPKARTTIYAQTDGVLFANEAMRALWEQLFADAFEGLPLLRVIVAGVNRPDVLQRAGAYPPPPGASGEWP